MAISAIVLTLPSLAIGQSQSLPTVVLTATRSPLALEQVLADVTVLTRADIERQAVGGLADLLRMQASFELTRTGGPGANTSLFVRGADTRHTVVLIDGVRVDSQATGGASWAALPLAQIERIEIVRGPTSALYGSDAVGGVVQIFTRKGEGPVRFELGTGAGNLGLAKLDASLTGKNGVLDYALSVAGERSSGFNSRPVADPGYAADKDGHRSHSASARLGAQLSTEHRVEMMAMQGHLWARFDGSAKPTVDDTNSSDTQVLRASWSAQWNPGSRSELSIGESRDRYESGPWTYLTETRIRSYTWNHSLKLGPGQLTAMLERREDRLLNTGLSATLTPGQGDRHQNAIAAGYLWSAGALSVQAHGRHDQDSEFGGIDTGTLAVGYQLAPAWRLRTSMGTAFRAPTLYQGFSDYGPDPKLGALPLRPEHGRNTELGLQFKQGEHEFSLSAYRNLIKDLIIWGDAGTCASAWGCFQNVGQARLQGISLQASTRLAGVWLSGSLDSQAPKDVTQRPAYANYGKQLARRSSEHARLSAATEWAGWRLSAQTVISGKRYDNAANSVMLGGYALLNLDAQYSITRALTLQLQMDNAFDRAYQTANGYASMPRSLFVGLRYQPGL